MATVPAPKRGEIWLIDFDPALGAEIQKIRPAVIISMDTIGRLPLRMVVPVTDWKTPLFRLSLVCALACSCLERSQKRFRGRCVSNQIRFGNTLCPRVGTGICQPTRCHRAGDCVVRRMSLSGPSP